MDTPADNPTQLAAIKSAHAQAKAALATLQDNLGDATQAEIDAVKAKLAELERVLAAAEGVSDRTKKMYAVEPIETELAAAEQTLDAAKAAKDPAANGRDATEADGDTPTTAAKTGSAKAQVAIMSLVSMQTGGGGMELRRSGDDRMTWSIGSAGDKKSITVTTEGTDVTALHPGQRSVRASIADDSSLTLENLNRDQPVVQSQNLALGKQHGDDTVRLRLMDKYYSDKYYSDRGESGVYFGDTTPVGGPPTISGTANNPGTVTIHAGSLILGAEGKTFDLTKVTNPAFSRTVSGTPPGTRAGVSEMGQTYDEADNPEGDQYVVKVLNFVIGEGSGDAGTNEDLYSYSYTYLNKPRTGYIMIGSDGNPLYAYVIKGKYKIPLVYDHMHVNYGMWNTLKGEKPADLGIGFVTVLEGKDKTPLANIPRSVGTATYQGGWVATVRAPGEPVDKVTNFSEHQGLSEVTADFAKNTVKVDLKLASTLDGGPGFGQDETFATLSGGAIDGNGFMGTKASVLPGGTPLGEGELEKVGLQSSENGFTGKFSGAFYGPKAEEIGGVFDFDGKKLGAFRGAFGGGRREGSGG